MLDGGRLLAQSDRVKFEPRTGQTVLDLDTPEPRGGRRRHAGDGDWCARWRRPSSRRRPGSSAPASGTPTPRSGTTRSPPTGAWWRSIPPTRRPGTTWACCCTGWGGTTRRATCLRDRARAGRALLRGGLQPRLAAPRTAATSRRRCAATAWRSRSRRTTPTPTSTWPARWPARATRTDAVVHWQRYLDLDAGSPWARIARAHLEVLEPPAIRRLRQRRCEVLLVGVGGREHALAWKIAQSPLVEHLWAAPGNPGIARHARCLDLAADDADGLAGFATGHGVDLVVVGPEAAAGRRASPTAPRASGLAVFGPGRERRRHRGLEGVRQGADGRARDPDRALRDVRRSRRGARGTAASSARRSWSRPTASPPARARSCARRSRRPTPRSPSAWSGASSAPPARRWSSRSSCTARRRRSSRSSATRRRAAPGRRPGSQDRVRRRPRAQHRRHGRLRAGADDRRPDVGARHARDRGADRWPRWPPAARRTRASSTSD